MKIAVIGDYTVDISVSEVLSGKSLCLPAAVTISAGGVGRNIALNLKQKGAMVRFFTAYNPADAAGMILDTDSRSNNIDICNFNADRSDAFCAVFDERGRLSTGYHAISALERIAVTKLIDEIAGYQPDCLVLDANLLPEQLAAMRRWCFEKNLPFAFDAVAVPKARRLRGLLEGCLLVKFNRYEAEIFSGNNVADIRAAKEIAAGLLEQGARNVMVSLGADGCVFAGKEIFWRAAAPTVLVNAGGAGDAMFAAALKALAEDQPLAAAADAAMLAAARCCSDSAVVSLHTDGGNIV